MTYDVVFVHGTGVREPAYSKAFNLISERFKRRDNQIRVHRCYWGGVHGSTLLAGGGSIPDISATKALGDEVDEQQLDIELWRLLYQDPLFELKALALRRGTETESLPLGADSPAAGIDSKFRTFKPSSDLSGLFSKASLTDENLLTARDNLVKESDYQEAIDTAVEPLGDYCRALARALVAEAVRLLQQKEGELSVLLSASVRDDIVEQIKTYLGAQEKGLGNWLIDDLRGLLSRFATSWTRDRRFAISERIGGQGGDILLYQARGEAIRQFIAEIIQPLSGPIILIGHSLGGIACVDLLLLDPKIRSRIGLLVTVGSQSPALYELNALVSQAYDPNFKLPSDFPRWLNLYDINDFLSYVGRSVFPGHNGAPFIEDVEISSRQPFPKSHSAYWVEERTWEAIFERLP